MGYPNADYTRLRAYVGEPIPVNGSPADTFFSDDDILDLLNFTGLGPNSTADLYASAAEGWERKVAALAALTDVQSGGATRAMSKLFEMATKQAQHYRELAARREYARTNTITRAGTTIR